MKYKAVVKKTRDGLRLILYIKILLWIPIVVYRSLPSSITFIIDEDLVKWKDFYGDRLTIKDCRNTK